MSPKVKLLESHRDSWYVYILEVFQKIQIKLAHSIDGFCDIQSHIAPKSDGANGLVYHISFDDIQSIFKTYPAVKQKYTQNVPHKMSEKDFWAKFFQSYYFRRDQINTTSTDLFADCPVKENDGRLSPIFQNVKRHCMRIVISKNKSSFKYAFSKLIIK